MTTTVKPQVDFRKLQDIANDILECETFRSALNHFLASFAAKQNPELAEVAEYNFAVVKSSLKSLYEEMLHAKASIKKIVNTTPIKVTNYQYTPIEINALGFFQKDGRYTITE